MRIDLPGPAWAEIKDDPGDLTGEDEVIVRSAMKLTGEGADGKFSATSGSSAMMEFAMLARIITSWSFSSPINVANIRALKLSQLRPLRKAAEPFMLELREDADPNSQDGGGTGSES